MDGFVASLLAMTEGADSICSGTALVTSAGASWPAPTWSLPEPASASPAAYHRPVRARRVGDRREGGRSAVSSGPACARGVCRSSAASCRPKQAATRRYGADHGCERHPVRPSPGHLPRTA